VAVFLVSLR